MYQLANNTINSILFYKLIYMKKTIVILSLLSAGIFYGQEKDSLSLPSKEIQEVLLKAQRKKQYADKAVYSFDQDAIKSARHSKDLLVTLPELKHDLLSNKIASIKGGTVLFLINGIEASDAQLQSVQPENVVKVE